MHIRPAQNQDICFCTYNCLSHKTISCHFKWSWLLWKWDCFVLIAELTNELRFCGPFFFKMKKKRTAKYVLLILILLREQFYYQQLHKYWHIKLYSMKNCTSSNLGILICIVLLSLQASCSLAIWKLNLINCTFHSIIFTFAFLQIWIPLKKKNVTTSQ